MRGRSWTHYGAPAAFLLAVTIAILLIRAGMSQNAAGPATATLPQTPRKTVAGTTSKGATRKPPTTGNRYYTVEAGDTFGVISSKTGVPVSKLQQLNPNVQSTALFIGQRLRIR